MWCEKERKRKLIYYKKVINPYLEDQKNHSILTSVKKKIDNVKIKTNSYELHGEIGCWPVPKIPWDERVSHHCDIKRVEDEK